MFLSKKALTIASGVLAGTVVFAFPFQGMWYGEVGGGVGFSAFKQNTTVRLMNAPAPGLTNGYFNRTKKQLTLPSYVGAGVTLTKNMWVKTRIGVEISHLDYQFARGQVHPMINVGPNFDRLNYEYDATSTMGLAKVSFSKPIAQRMEGFVGLLGGVALNKLSDYTETVPPGSTARPMLAPFRNRVTTARAFGGHLGVNIRLDDHVTLSLAYRYVNAGKARLNTSTVQTTNSRYKTKSLTSHLLTVGVIV